jgi:predicted pyridoxine 5'-phosphate oxidase superfamily flavin-nucleotide-binding protein
MDYPNKARLKIFGRAKLIGAEDAETLAKLEVPDYRARVERGFLIDVEAFDWNCPQHITQRYTLAEVEAATAPLRARIAELEALAARP